MRLSVGSVLLIILLTTCDDEPVSTSSLGLTLSEKEVKEVQEEFNVLLAEFESVKAARDAIAPEIQTDAGFLYLDVLQAKLNVLSVSLLKLDDLGIEDAVMMIFMLIAEDARKDMTDMLENMDASRTEKKALLAKAAEWNGHLSSFTKQLNDVYLTANDLQQVTFSDTVIAEVKLFGNRGASFPKSGQEGSVTQVIISSTYGQTPPMTFRIQDLSTGETLVTETISQNFTYSNIWKKRAILNITLSLNNPSADAVHVNVKIIHTKKVMKTPDQVNLSTTSTVRQLTEQMADELEALYEALQAAYDDQFITTAEGNAVAVLATVVVNRFGYAVDALKSPRMYKYPQNQEAVGDVSEGDMEALETFMRKKETQEELISEILRKMNETQNKITDNLK